MNKIKIYVYKLVEYIIKKNFVLSGNTPNPPRPRFNSCRSEPRVGNSSWISDVSLQQSSKSIVVTGSQENGVSVPSPTSSSISSSSSTNVVNGVVSSAFSCPGVGPEKPPIVPGETRTQYRDQPASSASPPTRDKLRAEDKARRRMMNQQNSERVAAAAAAVATATPSVSSTEKLGQFLSSPKESLIPRRLNWSSVFFFFFFFSYLLPESLVFHLFSFYCYYHHHRHHHLRCRRYTCLHVVLFRYKYNGMLCTISKQT